MDLSESFLQIQAM